MWSQDTREEACWIKRLISPTSNNAFKRPEYNLLTVVRLTNNDRLMRRASRIVATLLCIRNNRARQCLATAKSTKSALSQSSCLRGRLYAAYTALGSLRLSSGVKTAPQYRHGQETLGARKHRREKMATQKELEVRMKALRWIMLLLDCVPEERTTLHFPSIAWQHF